MAASLQREFSGEETGCSEAPKSNPKSTEESIVEGFNAIALLHLEEGEGIRSQCPLRISPQKVITTLNVLFNNASLESVYAINLIVPSKFILKIS